MSGKKILILTASHLCRNPRVVKEATTLGAAGFDVTVMSVSVLERFERMDLALMQGQPFQRKVLDLRVANLAQRGATWGARLLSRSLKIETAQSLGPAGALLRFARSHPADLTIAHTEIPLWAARHLSRGGRRVAVDMEDWYSEDLLPADRRSRPLRLLQQAEHWALHHAAYTSTTSDCMAAALAVAYGCPKPVVLRNTFPLAPRSRLDRPIGAEPPAFIWFSQTIGPGRGLEAFLAAWAQTRTPSRAILLGDSRPDYQQHLLSRLPESRRTDLSFIPLVPPGEVAAMLNACDIGLALEPHEPRNKYLTTSNKIFQYLNAGLAVVATNTAGQSEVMQAAPGCGLLIAADGGQQLTKQLDDLLGDRDRLRSCQIAARSAASTQFSWAHDASRLLAAVEQALATHPPRTERVAPAAS